MLTNAKMKIAGAAYIVVQNEIPSGIAIESSTVLLSDLYTALGCHKPVSKAAVRPQQAFVLPSNK